MRSEPPVLEVRDVTKHYRMGEEVVRALDGVSLAISCGRNARTPCSGCVGVPIITAGVEYDGDQSPHDYPSHQNVHHERT